MQVSIHIHPGQFRVTRFSAFAVIEMTETTGATTADAAIFLRTRDQCDKLIKAAVEAKRLLSGETSDPAEPGLNEKLSPPAPETLSEADVDDALTPPGHQLPAGGLDEDDTWREATGGPADLTDGHGDYSCPAQGDADADGNESLLCWRRAGHTGCHWDDADKRWWGGDETVPAARVPGGHFPAECGRTGAHFPHGACGGTLPRDGEPIESVQASGDVPAVELPGRGI